MFKKLFRFKRKQHDLAVRSSAPKKSMDSASTAILSRQFPPLESRVDSPSDLLNVVGNPSTVKNEPVTSNDATQSNEKPLYQLAIRNIASPITIELTPIVTQNEISVTEADSQHAMNLDTSREDKTLIEKVMADRAEFERLKQQILEFEQEKQMWDEKFKLYEEQEKQLKSIIHKNNLQIEKLQYRHVMTQRRSEQAQQLSEQAQQRSEQAEQRSEQAQQLLEQAQQILEQAQLRSEQAQLCSEQAQQRSEPAQQRSEPAQLPHLTRPFNHEEAGIYGSSNGNYEEGSIEEVNLQDYGEYQHRMEYAKDVNRYRESQRYQQYSPEYYEEYRKRYVYPYSHPRTRATPSYEQFHHYQQRRRSYHVEQHSYPPYYFN
ncbi:hypothetical protein EDC96DRAFT_491148 [Choanephora cucurbitarum]|nr:hypothetical protein EDC96DRAFT_491148 [Choanephora cucurbitarum]